MEYRLYNWQRDCLNKWKQNSCHGIVNVTTGAGKTILAIEAIKLLKKNSPNLRVRIVVPTIALVKQWRNSLLRQLSDANMDFRLAQYHGSVKNDYHSDICIYVVNSARYSLASHILEDFSQNNPVFLIADECHHYGSAENGRIFDFIPYIKADTDKYYCMGLSATPFSDTNRSLLTFGLGKEVYRYRANDALSDGIVSPFSVYEIDVPFMPEEWERYAKITLQMEILFKKLISEYPKLSSASPASLFSILKNIAAEEDDEDSPVSKYISLSLMRKEITILASSRLNCALEILKRLHTAKQTLVFCERIEQAEGLKKLLIDNGFPKTAVYHSKMNKEARSNVMNAFKEHSVNILISCRSLDEGMDVPDASIAIVLSSTSVERQRIQRLGRVLRQSALKEVAVLYYIYIRASSEDNAYLAEQDGFPIQRLKYYDNDRSFINENYESHASKILKPIACNLDDERRKELSSCLIAGQTNPDWLLPEDILCEKISSAKTVHEKNYYLLMKKLSINTV